MGTVLQKIPENALCPGCGTQRSLLYADKAGAGARQCIECGGWFLDRDAAYHFLVDELGVDGAGIGRLLAAPGARHRQCAACDGQTSAIVVRRGDVDLCGRCGAAFLLNEDMRELSNGRLGGPPIPDPVSGVHAKPPPQPISYDEVKLPEAPTNPFGAPELSGPLPLPEGFRPPTRPGARLASASGPMAHDATSPTMSRRGTISDLPTVSESYSDASISRPDRTRAASSDSARSASDLAPLSGVDLSAPDLAAVSYPGGVPAASTSSSSMRAQDSAGGGAGQAAPRRRGLAIALASAGLLVLVGVGGGAWFVLGADEPADVEQPADDDGARYAKYLRHYPFGGRNVDEWAAALNLVRPGGPQENRPLYAVAKQRALRLGLVVDDAREGAPVVVDLGEPLVKQLLKKLEVK
jgi:Zn-finger nucleic acid-binding protein